MRHSNPAANILDVQTQRETPVSQILCPSCGEEISLSEALRTQYADKFEREFKMREQVAAALIKQKEALLAKKAQLLDREYNDKLAAERAAIEKRLRDQIAATNNIEIEDLKNRVSEQNKKLEDAMGAELELRKRARTLEEREKSVELELVKKFDGEKLKIEQDIVRRISEQERLKLAEKDKQLEDMRLKIEELKRKSELTSQQLQGEVLELELESTLKRFCIVDVIEPVGKGIRGADIIHKVMTSAGQHVGTIVWEAKRTKSWTDSWVEKIKEDQRAISAECAVIVSEVLPKGITGLSLYDGVWVCDTKTILGLATALRVYLLQVHAAKASMANKDEKMEIIYRYLTGTQFSQRIQALVETFKDMQETLSVEKKAFHKIWAQREQQLEKMILNTASVYGSVQGIVGGALPKIATLELA